MFKVNNKDTRIKIFQNFKISNCSKLAISTNITHSNICNGSFLRKWFIVDVQLGSKYAFEYDLIDIILKIF